MASTEEKAIASLLEFGLGDIVYTPDKEQYQIRNQSYWSLTSRLKPWAIVQPRNTDEVSKAVKALVRTEGCQFAIRRYNMLLRLAESTEHWIKLTSDSGGHMSWPGANNINDGITIDFGLMNTTTYNSENETVSLQPGGTWTSVYKELEKRKSPALVFQPAN